MQTFYLLLVALAIVYTVSMVKKYIGYKKLNPTDIISLTEDNQSIRTVCGVLMTILIVTSGISFKEVYDQGIVFNDEFWEYVLIFFFFLVLYIPLTTRTKVSNVGIYRNSNLIYWKDVVEVEYLKPDSKGRLKVKVLYKNNINKELTIELIFKKKMDEYEAFKESVKKYFILPKKGKNKNAK